MSLHTNSIIIFNLMIAIKFDRLSSSIQSTNNDVQSVSLWRWEFYLRIASAITRNRYILWKYFRNMLHFIATIMIIITVASTSIENHINLLIISCSCIRCGMKIWRVCFNEFSQLTAERLRVKLGEYMIMHMRFVCEAASIILIFLSVIKNTKY